MTNFPNLADRGLVAKIGSSELDLSKYLEVFQASVIDGAKAIQRDNCYSINVNEPESVYVFFNGLWVKLKGETSFAMYLIPRSDRNRDTPVVQGFDASILSDIDDRLKAFLGSLEEKAKYFHTHPDAPDASYRITPSDSDFKHSAVDLFDLSKGIRLFESFGIISNQGITSYRPTQAFYDRLMKRYFENQSSGNAFIDEQGVIAFKDAIEFFKVLEFP